MPLLDVACPFARRHVPSHLIVLCCSRVDILVTFKGIVEMSYDPFFECPIIAGFVIFRVAHTVAKLVSTSDSGKS
jgi:hypothetical protein